MLRGGNCFTIYKCIKSTSTTPSAYTMLYVIVICQFYLNKAVREKREREQQGYGKETKKSPRLTPPRLGEIGDSLSGCESHCSLKCPISQELAMGHRIQALPGFLEVRQTGTTAISFYATTRSYDLTISSSLET